MGDLSVETMLSVHNVNRLADWPNFNHWPNIKSLWQIFIAVNGQILKKSSNLVALVSVNVHSKIEVCTEGLFL